MAITNEHLHRAKNLKRDEFYTRLEDIENELPYYSEQFRGAVVYCNCDLYHNSNFYKYFKDNFDRLGLKKLIATAYIDGGCGMIATYDERDKEVVRPLRKDGSFLSDECVSLLEIADIVCTNPPFSLFREYLAQLIEFKKRFLIIGNIKAVTYKSVFPLLKEGTIRLGINTKLAKFRIPETYPTTALVTTDKDGKRFLTNAYARWFTNLECRQRRKDLPLFRRYHPEAYPRYDNFDAIEVSGVGDIPVDYSGVMGVPISFMDRYDPDRFELIGLATRWSTPQLITKTYDRRSPNLRQLNAGVVLNEDGKLRPLFARILIRNKKSIPPDPDALLPEPGPSARIVLPTRRGTPSPIYLDAATSFNPGARMRVLRRRAIVSPLPWCGGKTRHLSWLLPLLPRCRHFVEPFAGSAVVLLNRDRSPLETINDINGDLVNFFRILRDQPEELIWALELTPFSREEFTLALGEDQEISPLERARRFCVLCQQSYSGRGTIATPGFWTPSLNHSVRSVAASVAKKLIKNSSLRYTAERLLTVQIDNRPAIDCILKYDSPETLFYCDPPYAPETRRKNDDYANEMTTDDHRELADLLNLVKGKVAISGYDSPLYSELFPAPKWRKYIDKERSLRERNCSSTRREVLWMNYDP